MPLPKNTIDETHNTYDRLRVLSYAGAAPGGKTLWNCLCRCGKKLRVRGDQLRGGSIVSCGCSRADPAVRRAARLTTDPERRLELARLGGRARAAARKLNCPANGSRIVLISEVDKPNDVPSSNQGQTEGPKTNEKD
jgi:hypothetical protein